MTAIFCIQCALEALVANNGEVPSPASTTFNESIEEHMQRAHPDLEATQRRRIELEQQAEKIMKKRLRESLKKSLDFNGDIK